MVVAMKAYPPAMEVVVAEAHLDEEAVLAVVPAEITVADQALEVVVVVPEAAATAMVVAAVARRRNTRSRRMRSILMSLTSMPIVQTGPGPSLQQRRALRP